MRQDTFDSPGTNHLLSNLRIDLGKLAEQARKSSNAKSCMKGKGSLIGTCNSFGRVFFPLRYWSVAHLQFSNLQRLFLFTGFQYETSISVRATAWWMQPKSLLQCKRWDMHFWNDFCTKKCQIVMTLRSVWLMYAARTCILDVLPLVV